MIEEDEKYDTYSLEYLKEDSENNPDLTLLELISRRIEKLDKSFNDMLAEKNFMNGAAMSCNGKLRAAFFRLKEKIEAVITPEN